MKRLIKSFIDFSIYIEPTMGIGLNCSLKKKKKSPDFSQSLERTTHAAVCFFLCGKNAKTNETTGRAIWSHHDYYNNPSVYYNLLPCFALHGTTS